MNWCYYCMATIQDGCVISTLEVDGMEYQFHEEHAQEGIKTALAEIEAEKRFLDSISKS